MLTDLQQIRRTYEGTTHRMTQAALDRYRQTLAVLDEQRALARALGVEGVDRSCEQAAAQLAAEFPFFAKHAQPGSLLGTLDRVQANEALIALQDRHNGALAALAAMREEAVDSIRGGAGSGAARDAGDAPGGVGDRAGSLWRRLRGDA
jgi:hypothetical protein